LRQTATNDALKGFAVTFDDIGCGLLVACASAMEELLEFLAVALKGIFGLIVGLTHGGCFWGQRQLPQHKQDGKKVKARCAPATEATA
jgi:hypothetical protein